MKINFVTPSMPKPLPITIEVEGVDDFAEVKAFFETNGYLDGKEVDSGSYCRLYKAHCIGIFKITSGPAIVPVKKPGILLPNQKQA